MNSQKITEVRKRVDVGRTKAQIAYYNWKRKQAIYNLIKDCREQYNWNITLMCKIAGIKRKTYYKCLHTPTSQKELSDQKLTNKIKEIAASNNSLFDAGKMTMMLNKTAGPDEEKYGYNRVARLMSINGIRCQRAKYNKTWRSKCPSGDQTAENILHRDFNVDGPNQK